MNSKKEGKEIKGYITFKIDLNRYTDHLYYVMDSEICGDLKPIQIYIYNDDEEWDADHIFDQIQSIANDINSELFKAVKKMRDAAHAYYFEEENIGGETAIFCADLWFCEKGKEVRNDSGVYIRNTGVPPSGINFSLNEIFEDVGYDVDWW